MSYLSVSTWSLHRLLGPLRLTTWNAEAVSHQTVMQDQPEVHTLLELPLEAANRGYQAIEVCHFHFPSTEAAYLDKLRVSFSEAGISFDTLLLDYGDITTTDEARRTADMGFIREWIDVASQCGAKQIRLIAGEARHSDESAIRQSAAALSELAQYADSRDVRVITENFKELTSTGESCLKLLNWAGEAISMITDFGNFRGQAKYEEIAMTTPHSVSVHAKAAYDDSGYPDEDEFVRCLEAVKATDYNGAFVLIYDGPGDMWDGLDRIKRIVARYL
ncbi:sugar phosphate isomerase/epimerase family protein [Cohnella luojiensis]|uniref:Sugar phosphate isomerase/epimerase n=1 Tax=Cohnella luojiensis TaxID=652876 RepID=A0A4Y8LX24_9BACL|nr:TIM barrel protein [Cohnella luojiensis]TFE26631.1 sugar phosphate isomerase/epimerase [Cohnella luojiensis]